MEGFDYTFDDEYTITLQGYDVSVLPSEVGDGYFHVVVTEEGAEVYTNDIPAPIQQEELTDEAMMQNVAQAAVDFFEASRDTLGEGAGAKMSSQKKKAFFYGLGICEYRKEWFNSLKGTPSEDMAYNLLSSYIDLDYELSNKESIAAELYEKKTDVLYQLAKLELEHMKNSKPGREIVIITASLRKDACWNAAEMQAFLDQFIGCPLESQVMLLVDELLEIEEQIRAAEKNEEPNWDQLHELEQQMDSLAMDQFHRDLEECLPTSGAEAFPNMAGEVAELMQGVEMDAPLDPMMMPADPMMPFASKKKAKMEGEDETREESYQEWEPVDERIEEYGEAHEGLDPAERDEGPFALGDNVTLSKEFEAPGPLTGVHFEFPKGTKGVIDGLHDDHGNCYDVCLEDGRTVKIPAEFLSK